MSSSSVCQGLQSCLEPRLMEPRVLRLKLAPAKSNFFRAVAPRSCTAHLDNPETESHTEENNTTITTTNNKNNNDDCDEKSHKTDDIRGWSFLHFLSNNSQNNTKENTENEKVYVHPLVKRSSVLSEKSLEMCTESLGSETGSQVSESSGDDNSLISLETEISTTTDTSKLSESLMTKRKNRSLSFPPPLTSISGSNVVQVRPHREGGRLVLQAVTVTSSQTYFHAERRDGRLRLCLVKDRPANIDDQEEEEEDNDEGEEEEEEEFAEEEYDEESEEDWGEDMEGKSEKVRGQIGIKKLPRPSRCKEGGRGHEGLLNWEPFWVAT